MLYIVFNSKGEIQLSTSHKQKALDYICGTEFILKEYKLKERN